MAAILIQRCSASKHAGHCQNYTPCAQSVHTRGHVAATYPWDLYPQHFHVCANVVILSLLHVPATRPYYLSPQCVLHTFFVPATCRLSVYYTRFLSLLHVAATCPCNMTPRVCPPLQVKHMQKKTRFCCTQWALFRLIRVIRDQGSKGWNLAPQTCDHKPWDRDQQFSEGSGVGCAISVGSGLKTYDAFGIKKIRLCGTQKYSVQ